MGEDNKETIVYTGTSTDSDDVRYQTDDRLTYGFYQTSSEDD